MLDERGWVVHGRVEDELKFKDLVGKAFCDKLHLHANVGAFPRDGRDRVESERFHLVHFHVEPPEGGGNGVLGLLGCWIERH